MPQIQAIFFIFKALTLLHINSVVLIASTEAETNITIWGGTSIITDLSLSKSVFCFSYF